MDKTTEFINSIFELEHAAAPRIYDPVKAHEYYMRTRELKGRSRSSAALKTKQQKEGWSYVKATVAENKKKEAQTLSFFNKLVMKKLRDDVVAKRKELSDKIKTFNLKFKGVKGLDKNATKAEREKFAAEMKAERAKLSADLKDTLDKAKTAYKTAIEGIKTKYESELDSEFNALKSMKTKRPRR